MGANVWAAHDDFGDWRWSYVIALALQSNLTVFSTDIANDGSLAVWEVGLFQKVSTVTIVGVNESFSMAETSAPADHHSIEIRHVAVAPVLPSGMVLLGDVGRWATMSSRRIATFSATVEGLTAQVCPV